MSLVFSSLTASFPSLYYPDPALADTLAPDPPHLCDGHDQGASPTAVPHPDVLLVEPAANAPVQLSVCTQACLPQGRQPVLEPR
jgi:hypothetical protein